MGDVGVDVEATGAGAPPPPPTSQAAKDLLSPVLLGSRPSVDRSGLLSRKHCFLSAVAWAMAGESMNEGIDSGRIECRSLHLTQASLSTLSKLRLQTSSQVSVRCCGSDVHSEE